MPSVHSDHFEHFRSRTVEFDNSAFSSDLRGLYADWTAAGRPYHPIEERLQEIASLIGNTHTSDSSAGAIASEVFRQSHEEVARAVNAGTDDIVLFRGNGMTGAINWLQDTLGLRGQGSLPLQLTPIVIVTGMEHHSNHISWKEKGADVFKISMSSEGLPDLDDLEKLCVDAAATGRPLIGSFTAASNVTGIRTPIYDMAEIVHRHGGRVIIDFAASAPYDRIDMHPEGQDSGRHLDAVVFSPHKFLGGPGAPGVIIFNRNFYNPDRTPVVVGGGIVSWVDPQGACEIVSDIHHRENAGSPSVLGAARVALVTRLKNEMDLTKIAEREHHLTGLAIDALKAVPGLTVLEERNRDRLGIVSFVVEDKDYALIVKLLSDKFGIQARGGCSCAGPYGHFLLDVSDETSLAIRSEIMQGDATRKPGWVRISLHPTMRDTEVFRITEAVREIVEHYDQFAAGYTFNSAQHSWHSVSGEPDVAGMAHELLTDPLSGTRGSKSNGAGPAERLHHEGIKLNPQIIRALQGRTAHPPTIMSH